MIAHKSAFVLALRERKVGQLTTTASQKVSLRIICCAGTAKDSSLCNNEFRKYHSDHRPVVLRLNVPLVDDDVVTMTADGVSRLPTYLDDVVLDRPAAEPAITLRSGTQRVARLDSEEAITGGTLYAIDELTATGATRFQKTHDERA
jgi:hypothetical protein